MVQIWYMFSAFSFSFDTPPYDSGGVLWFHVRCPCVCPFVRPSIRILFPDGKLSKHQWISPNLVCALTLWRSGSGLQMGKFRRILKELSVRDMSYFHFRMITWVNINVFSPNLAFALILWRSSLGLLMGNFVKFWQLSARDMIMVGYYHFTFLLLTCYMWTVKPVQDFRHSWSMFSIHVATDKRVYPHNIFLISLLIHMLWVVIRSASRRRF